jgi:hypothetical protein
MSTFEDRVRGLAHAMWEREGRPEGRALIHWFLACDIARTADFELTLAAADVTKEAWEPYVHPDDPRGRHCRETLVSPLAVRLGDETLLVTADFHEKTRLSTTLRSQGLVVHEAGSALCAFEQLNTHDGIGTVVIDDRCANAGDLSRYIRTTRAHIRILGLARLTSANGGLDEADDFLPPLKLGAGARQGRPSAGAAPREGSDAEGEPALA